MSVDEEDPSLKDLVTKTLHSSGVLGKIQAQLRASVFLALEDEFNNKNIPLVNKESSKLLSSNEGSICAALVYDFLQCLKLEFTQSVFAPESGMTSSWSLKERHSLASDLDLSQKSELKTPLLCQLINEWQSGRKNIIKTTNDTIEEETKLSNSLFMSGKLPSLTSTNGKMSSLPPILSDSHNAATQGNGALRNATSNESLSERSSKVNKDVDGNIFTTEKLSDKNDSSEEKSISRNLKQKLVKNLINSESNMDGSSISSEEEPTDSKKLTDTEEQYEDDFSSVSEKHDPDKQDNSSNNSPSKTKDNDSEEKTKTPDDTESREDDITEEISEDISDLLNSACSLESDKTKDLSISEANKLVSYQEDL